MSLVLLISIVAFVFFLQLGFYVSLKSLHSSLNRSFFYLSLYFACWSLLLIFSYFLTYPDYTASWNIIVYAGLAFAPFLLFRFLALLRKISKKKNTYQIAYVVLMLIGLFFSFSFIMKGVVDLISPSATDVHLNALFTVLNSIFFGIITATAVFIPVLFFIWSEQSLSKTDKRKMNLSVCLTAASLLLVVIYDYVIPVFLIEIYVRMSHMFFMPVMLGMAYVTLRYPAHGLTYLQAAPALFNEISKILVVCDKDGEILRCNSFIDRLICNGQHSLKGRNIYTFLHEKDADALIKKALTDGHAGPHELKVLSLSGKSIPVRLSCDRLVDSFGDLYGLFFYGEDLLQSEQLKKEIQTRTDNEQSLKDTSNQLSKELNMHTREISAANRARRLEMTQRMRTEKTIQQEIGEMEILMKEIHFRVYKNLRFILSILEASGKNVDVIDAHKDIRDLYQRINTVLMVHEHTQIEGDYGEVDFKDMLKRLIDIMPDDSHNHLKPEVFLDADDTKLTVDLGVPLGLVANELLTNAFRHAFTNCDTGSSWHPWIHVTFRRDHHDQLNLEVKDNGCGMPVSSDETESDYIGMQLAHMLVKDQLSGDISVERAAGTIIRVCVPME